ncbi:hypothetical protein [Paludisphaera mucosa]|uniref:Uncharacterized protein n=1 Tax=Paludisphaera mucosa TaxID=3030827 RepID=A0ABT6F5J8_9BACT|nr:hypothetical protein [Paludisphaera mucosa]MDG3002853.1 hypothetical protein [Paludisphaera mucosa]
MPIDGRLMRAIARGVGREEMRDHDVLRSPLRATDGLPWELERALVRVLTADGHQQLLDLAGAIWGPWQPYRDAHENAYYAAICGKTFTNAGGNT